MTRGHGPSGRPGPAAENGPQESPSLAGPHRRYDPLRDAWVLVSPVRADRPWLGQTERPRRAEPAPEHDDHCALCPGNVRASGRRNPDYTGPFVFENDFPALRPDSAWERVDEGLHLAESEAGTARVVCFSPRHDLSLGSLPVVDVRAVIDVWAAQTAELGERFQWVQVFENRGEAMGASNPHPHGQVWAGSALPTEPSREDATQRAHIDRTGRQLLADVVAQERDGPRVVEATEDWLAIVPYWAAWPFELLVLPLRALARLPDLDEDARTDLATFLVRLVTRLDRLFDEPFPYSMGWHGAPTGPDRTRSTTGAEGLDPWRLHAHVYPPLLRADARKFMVGYELLAEPQRDLTPEDAAARLRAVDLGG